MPLALSLLAALLTATAVHADGNWATTIGFDAKHVIVDANSPDAARLTAQYPARPRARPMLPPTHVALNNVQVKVTAALAGIADPRAAPRILPERPQPSPAGAR